MEWNNGCAIYHLVILDGLSTPYRSSEVKSAVKDFGTGLSVRVGSTNAAPVAGVIMGSHSGKSSVITFCHLDRHIGGLEGNLGCAVHFYILDTLCSPYRSLKVISAVKDFDTGLSARVRITDATPIAGVIMRSHSLINGIIAFSHLDRYFGGLKGSIGGSIYY